MSKSALEHLPALDGEYTVTSEQKEQYRRNGHILLRGIATPEEIAPYEEHVSELVAKLKADALPLEERDTYHKAFLQCGNLWEIDEVVKRFVTSPRFGKIAAELMGVNGVRLYHDQALYKEPGGGATPWHQDQVYWPFDTPNTVTMWMPLVEAPVESGTMVLVSESQKEGFINEKMFISDASADFFRRLVIERGWECIINDMNAGDATFHSGWTVHKAVGNATPNMRKTMTVIWYEDGVKIAEPINDLQPLDMERWFPGQKPGDVAGTHLNPVCYSKK